MSATMSFLQPSPGRLLIPLLILAQAGVLPVSGLCQPQAPGWTLQKPNRPDLFQGVGYSHASGSPESDRQRADNNAIAEIVNQISITVTSALNSYYHEEMSGGEVVVSSEAVTRVSSQFAHETIKGIRIAERFHDPAQKIFYSYAFISRAELDRQFRDKAESAVKLCSDYHRHARQALAERNVYAAITNYTRALGELFIAQAFLKTKIEGRLDDESPTEMLQPRLESELSSILGKLEFSIIAGSGQRAERRRSLGSPLVGRVTYKGKASAHSVSGMPVVLKFVNANGRLNSPVITDSRGEFVSQVDLVEGSQSETGLIHAGMDLTELEPFRGELGTAFDRLEQLGCTFEFDIDVAASVRIFVGIYEETEGSPVAKPFTTAEIIRALVADKYTVIEPDHLNSDYTQSDIERSVQSGDDQTIIAAAGEDANYAVVGRVVSEAGLSIIEGIRFAYANADVRVIDLNTGRVLVSSVQSRVKGSGGNQQQAHQKAIKKCSESVSLEIVRGLNKALK